MTIKVSALPQIKEMGWTPESNRYKAYAAVLRVEAYALQLLNRSHIIKPAKERTFAMREAEGKLNGARVIGYLLLEFEAQSSLFGTTPSSALVEWLLESGDQNDIVIKNGELLRDKFIRLFRTSNNSYPPSSSHPSRPSFDSLEDMIKDTMESTGSDYGTSRRKVLVRDGFRCVVTGLYNVRSLEKCSELQHLQEEVTAVVLETVHILNESTMQNINPEIDSEDTKTYNKTHYAAGAMAILQCFGFSKFVDTFKKSGGVHQVWNLLSLQHDVRALFDHLDMWFEYTNQPNCYKVCTAHGRGERCIRHLHADPDRRADSGPMSVVFNSRYKEVPPPDPFLLALHAMCARVAHMSGAAEFFDQLEWDAEETRTLASDGSSGPLLEHFLSPFAVMPAMPVIPGFA